MSYITREDGEQFVIPSYRDVLSARNKAALKKDILKLSESYGEYITLQEKGPNQMEVAFSTEIGYLLGESIWHRFQRPLDMIYCEQIPNTEEAILVIVKAGSVYLDGSFPIDSIPEELVIFLTQENNFEIFVYGDVPIAKEPEDGKFSFEESSVKSFTVLEEPAFPTLPLLEIYKLQLVDIVLKARGIGVLPIKEVVVGILVLGILYGLWSYLTYTPPPTVAEVKRANPFVSFYREMESPDPTKKLLFVQSQMNLLSTMPGWHYKNIEFSSNKLTATVVSSGTSLQELQDWCTTHKGILRIEDRGVYVDLYGTFKDRAKPMDIYPLTEVVMKLIDNINQVYHGNNIALGKLSSFSVYKSRSLTIRLTNTSPQVIGMIAEQVKNLPVIFDSLKLSQNDGVLSGTLTIKALGS